MTVLSIIVLSLLVLGATVSFFKARAADRDNRLFELLVYGAGAWGCSATALHLALDLLGQ